MSVLLFELREAKEIGKEADIVTFHGYTCGNKYRPPDRLGIELDALPQAHRVFFLSGEPRIIDDPICSLLMVVVIAKLAGCHRDVGGLDVLLHGHVSAD